MNKVLAPVYYEDLEQHSMPIYPFFLNKLEQIQKLAIKIKGAELMGRVHTNCQDCLHNLKFYQLGNIIWPSNLKHKMEEHQSYPSDYFMNMILNTDIISNQIVNPPIQLEPSQIQRFSYIPLHYNKLLIIDALMKQGSYPRYETRAKPCSEGQPEAELNLCRRKFIYSEHSGVISIKNKAVDNIIVSAETDRTDVNDNNIYLPHNNSLMEKYEYLFHTHPNTKIYGGRIKEGIIYEFPSSNDIFNFMKYRNKGMVQASLVVAPEGSYLIRPLKFVSKYQTHGSFFHRLRKFTLKLEKYALKKLSDWIPKISDPDIFHQKIGSEFRYIRLYNKFLEPYNLFIEYYPRIKRNGEWCLQTINLPYLAI